MRLWFLDCQSADLYVTKMLLNVDWLTVVGCEEGNQEKLEIRGSFGKACMVVCKQLWLFYRQKCQIALIILFAVIIATGQVWI